MKLYCFKSYRPGEWFTEGKIYEVNKRDLFTADDGYHPSDREWRDNCRLGTGTRWSDYLVPLVSRTAEVGEWVYLVKEPRVNDGDYATNYHKGDVVEITSFGIFASVKAKNPNFRAGFRENEYLVLDGFKPEPEKAEPEYLNMRVVCVESDDAFTVGKVYEFVDGKVKDNDGTPRLSSGFNAKTLDEWNWRFGVSHARFIEFNGE